MAQTFTGLKLQGKIGIFFHKYPDLIFGLGKFGRIDLSDVVSFVEISEDKVISTTESGILLLWDDDHVAFSLVNKNREPCHNGISLSNF